MIFIRNLSRLLVGLVFIFSGFVKGVDPLGTAYRIEDYFVAYGIEWAIPLSLFLALFLCALEFVLGISLLFNAWVKKTSWLLFPMMIFFTVLTLIDAIWEPVPDCGCFGDAVKLTNWETFYKNIVLIILTAIVFFGRNKFKAPKLRMYNLVVLGLAIVGFVYFMNFNLSHLPLIDFRDWKVGSDMDPESVGEEKIYLSFKSNVTGEVNEYLSPDYPWQDSLWNVEWEFVDQRVDDSELIRAHELIIQDSLGQDFTEMFIPNPDYQFLVISYDISKADEEALDKVLKFYRAAEEDRYSLIGITSSLPDETMTRVSDLDTDEVFEFYYGDDVVLKSMVRANPGIILMKDGVIIEKWHHNDLPSYPEVKSEYMNE
jgi:uncharacterized membrane protein YphA (DoxX/SURF4 family)